MCKVSYNGGYDKARVLEVGMYMMLLQILIDVPRSRFIGACCILGFISFLGPLHAAVIQTSTNLQRVIKAFQHLVCL